MNSGALWFTTLFGGLPLLVYHIVCWFTTLFGWLFRSSIILAALDLWRDNKLDYIVFYFKHVRIFIIEPNFDI